MLILLSQDHRTAAIREQRVRLLVVIEVEEKEAMQLQGLLRSNGGDGSQSTGANRHEWEREV